MSKKELKNYPPTLINYAIEFVRNIEGAVFEGVEYVDNSTFRIYFYKIDKNGKEKLDCALLPLPVTHDRFKE